MNVDRAHYSGQLFRYHAGAHHVFRALEALPGTTVNKATSGGIWKISYETERPLVSQVEPQAIYFYSFLFRRGAHSETLLVSQSNETTASMLKRLRVRPVTRPKVNVGVMANDLFDSYEDYCLGGVYAQVIGQTAVLRSASFFGDNLAEADLYRPVHPYLSPSRVSLRSTKSNIEVLSVNLNGQVSIGVSSLGALEEVESCLEWMDVEGYIDWTQS